MKNKTKITDVVFILDRSGSMRGVEADTIGGYNGYINDFKNKRAKITTVLFDDKYEMITKRQDVNKVPELTEKEYYVRGCTALLDAIGNMETGAKVVRPYLGVQLVDISNTFALQYYYGININDLIY